MEEKKQNIRFPAEQFMQDLDDFLKNLGNPDIVTFSITVMTAENVRVEYRNSYINCE